MHPNGFEWCINAPAIDGDANVYVESEDGNIYVLDQGHSGVFTTPKFKLFTNLAIGAAYTPFSIDCKAGSTPRTTGTCLWWVRAATMFARTTKPMGRTRPRAFGNQTNQTRIEWLNP